MDCKEIKPVNLKGNQPWIFIGGADVEVDTPIIWPLDVKCQIIGKDFDVWKDWRHEEKWVTENEIFGWHHRLNGHEFDQISGDSVGQESLACCSLWGHKELDMTEQQQYYTRKPRTLNWGNTYRTMKLDP